MQGIQLQDGSIAVEGLAERHRAAAANCLARVFAKQNPLIAARGMAVDEFLPVAELVVDAALEPGLSLVLERVAGPSRGDIVGVSLSEDFAQVDHLRDLELVPEALRPLLSLFALFDAALRARHRIEAGTYLYHSFLGVDHDQLGLGTGGAGLAEELCRRTLERGAAAGYRFCVGYATHLLSQRMYGKLGFEVLDRIDYAGFVFEGCEVFRGISLHRSAIAAIRAIGAEPAAGVEAPPEAQGIRSRSAELARGPQA